MLIKVWDAERLASGGGGSSSGNRSGTPSAPEPLQELPAGGFHFCQFALTRWREEARATGKDTTTTTTNNGVARYDGGTGRGEEDKDGGVQERRKEEEKGEEGGVREGRVGGLAVAAAVLKPSTPPVGEEDDGPCLSGGHSSSSNNNSDSAFSDNCMLAPCREQHSVSAVGDNERMSLLWYGMLPCHAVCERRTRPVCDRFWVELILLALHNTSVYSITALQINNHHTAKIQFQSAFYPTFTTK